ncbi:hypothetical protein HMPREF9104_02626 [Lentilactobacillus kisonensis F0435]|uniref:Uncharacterized protein n=1 Tax=Lentilactobacillus kisonensis F0435 TaxID=797516 RepID=H1LJ34_9LACO|nr:hypothetical protein HMPREF9104_02626 [Lentilactobacillus kisonensis F0435]
MRAVKYDSILLNGNNYDNRNMKWTDCGLLADGSRLIKPQSNF